MMTENVAQTKEPGPGIVKRSGRMVWDLLTHPVTFVVLTIFWVVDLGAGSIAAYFNDPRFWVKMDAYTFADWMQRVAPATFPSSLWIYILVVLSYLMVASLLLCTVNWLWRRRRKLRGIAEFLVHLGFLLIFTGFVLGSMFGARSQLQLAEGGRAPVPGMGLELELSDFQVVTSPEGRPQDTASRIVVYRDGEEVTAGTARLNHPIIWHNTVIYPPDDYRSWVEGGVVELIDGQRAQVVSRRRTPLEDGTFLTIGGLLQSGQRRGSAVGPGILLQRHGSDGRVQGAAYLSPLAGQSREVLLAGSPVRLIRLLETGTGIYRVHRDPGVRLVILGTFILAAGSLWALVVYFRQPSAV